MVLAINQGVDNSCSNPVLQFFSYKGGVLSDPVSLEFQVFDVSDATKRSALLSDPDSVQSFPLAAGTKHVVDLADCPGGDKISTGCFIAAYPTLIGETAGLHIVRWFVTKEAGDAEQTYEQEFSVVETGQPLPTGLYATIQDMRDEGVTEELASDERIILALRLATRFVDRVTGRFFEPRKLTYTVDGRGGALILLQQPIIALESLSIETDPFFTSLPDLVSGDLFRIYNRHIEQGLNQPDDRNNPKIAFRRFLGDVATFRRSSSISFGDLTWPRGEQNISITGIFGYTEPDGSTSGATPIEIRHVTRLIALRELPQLIDFEQREDFNRRFKVTRERTKEQQIQYFDRLSGRAQTAFFGMFTGDPAIDNILAAFVRPPSLGAP